MSRIIKVEISSEIITNQEELANFCAFDEDLNSNNGQDYTRPETLTEVYETTVQWIFVEVKKETSDLNETISNALKII